MDTLITYKAIIKNNKNPCFIADYKSSLVLHCNDEMKKLLFEKREIINKPFYEVISDVNHGSDGIPMFNWHNKSVHNQEIYDTTLAKKFDVTLTKLSDSNADYLIIEYLVIESDDEKTAHFHLAKTICWLEMENASRLTSLLHLLAIAYKSDCAYIHLIDHGNNTIKLNSSWIDKSITDTTNYLVKDIEDIVGFEGLILWANCRDGEGIWDCDINRENSPQQVLDNIALATFGRRNLILCGIENEKGQLIATVSLGDSKSLLVNHNLLKFVAKLVDFVLKN